MKKQIVTAIAIGITGIFPGLAQDTENQTASTQQAPPSNMASLEQIFENCKSGIYNQKFENGRMVFCHVAGTAVIRTSLGAETGLEIANDNADNNAKASFVEWIKANVSSIKQSGREALVTIQGQSDGNEESTTEQSKSLDTNKKEVTQQAAGLVRGLSIVGSKQVGKQLVVVYKWSSKAFNAATNLEADSKASESAVTMPTTTGGVKRKAGVVEKTVVLPGWDQP